MKNIEEEYSGEQIINYLYVDICDKHSTFKLTNIGVQKIRDFINNLSKTQEYSFLYRVAIVNNYFGEIILPHEQLFVMLINNIDHTYHLFYIWAQVFSQDSEKIAQIISSYPMRDNCGQASQCVNQRIPYYENIIESIIINNCTQDFVNAMQRMDKSFTVDKFYKKYYNSDAAKIGVLI